MKYRDYLILPVLAMSFIYASCAYVGEPKAAAEPVASVDPAEISWGGESGEYGEYWYSAENGGCFTVHEEEREIRFISETRGRSALEESCYAVDDGHLRFRSNGKSYDLIFTDELTAYDTVSGTYFQRGDSAAIREALTGGKLVNAENKKDVFVLKANGKAAEYIGDLVCSGQWSLKTSDTITICDRSAGIGTDYVLVYNESGEICGIASSNAVYNLK